VLKHKIKTFSDINQGRQGLTCKFLDLVARFL
jgi:hypothetical protein